MTNNENRWHLEKTYDSLMTYGLNGIKYVPLINGGAVIALLTFLGNNADKAPMLKVAIYFFVAGIVVGGVLTITAYLTQLALYNEERGIKIYPNHRHYLNLTIILIIAGQFLFVIGAVTATQAF